MLKKSSKGKKIQMNIQVKKNTKQGLEQSWSCNQETLQISLSKSFYEV